MVPTLHSTQRAAEDLAACLAGLLSHERTVMVDFLQCLAEFDDTRAYLPLGYGTCFDYCIRALKLSNAAAFRRIAAARLLRRFPAVAAMLRDGRLCLTTLVMLKDVLTEANHREILARAAGLSKDAIAALVVVYRPRKPVPTDAVLPSPAPKLMVLPLAPAAAAAAAPVAGAATVSGATAALAAGTAPAVATATAPGSAPAAAGVTAAATDPAPAEPAAAALVIEVPRPVPLRLEPVTEELRVLRVTVSTAFLAELEEVKAILSHQAPSGKFEDVVRACFRVVIARHRKKTTPRRPPPGRRDRGGEARAPARRDRRHYPVDVVRAVWLRDGAGGCTFVGPDGTRCGSRHKLQLEHVVPVALGGLTTIANCTLRCQAHNLHAARLVFGAEWMAQFTGWGAFPPAEAPAR